MKIIEKYKRLPKWLRFGIHYGTSPVWFPISLVFFGIAYCLMAPIGGLYELWKEFE